MNTKALIVSIALAGVAWGQVSLPSGGGGITTLSGATDYTTALVNPLALKAPLASPTFSGHAHITGDNSDNLFSFASDNPIALGSQNLDYRTYFNVSGMLETQGWIVSSGRFQYVSGHKIQVIYPGGSTGNPTGGESFNFGGVGDHTGAVYQCEDGAVTSGGLVSYCYGVLDIAQNHRFSIEHDGRLNWANGTRLSEIASTSNLYWVSNGFMKSDSNWTFLGGVVSPTYTGAGAIKIYPGADSTAAINAYKADGTTCVGGWDSTNTRFGVGTCAPAQPLEVSSANGGYIRITRTNNVAATSEPGAINVVAPNASGGSVTWSGIITTVNVATASAEDSNLVLSTMSAGVSTDVLTLKGNHVGILTASPTHTLDVAGSLVLTGVNSAAFAQINRSNNVGNGSQFGSLSFHAPNASSVDRAWTTGMTTVNNAAGGSEDSSFTLTLQSAGGAKDVLVLNGVTSTLASALTISGTALSPGFLFTQTTAPTLANGQCSWSFTSNTVVTVTCKGSDGTSRTATLTMS